MRHRITHRELGAAKFPALLLSETLKGMERKWRSFCSLKHDIRVRGGKGYTDIEFNGWTH